MKRHFNWCALVSYPGRPEFLFGTVQAQTEMEAERELLALWQLHSPHAAPEIRAIHRGALVFEEDYA